MKLELTDSNKIIDVKFGEWLISKIQVELLSNINSSKFKKWDEYLTTSPLFSRLYDKSYSVAELLIFAVKQLKCSGIDSHIIIEFDPNVLVPGFDRLKLITALKTINYGTLDQKGSFVITDVFDDFAKNITYYVDEYYVW